MGNLRGHLPGLLVDTAGARVVGTPPESREQKKVVGLQLNMTFLITMGHIHSTFYPNLKFERKKQQFIKRIPIISLQS